MDPNVNEDQKPIEGNFEIAPMQAITKAEIDSQIATARQYPRKLSEFFKRSEAMITSDPETAESCLYQLKRRDPDSPTGFKIIEGESVRMAEIIAANYGNLRTAVHVTSSSPTRVSVRAVCHDLESNNLMAVEKQARTTYRDGSPYSDDMQITATNALISKALRDAVFRVVPKALIKPLKEKAKLVAFGTGAAFNDRRQKAFDWATKTRKVAPERVFAALGVAGLEDITMDHLALLSGLKSAILEGDQSVDEAFPPLDGSTAVTAESTFVRPTTNPEIASQKAAAAKTTVAAATTAPKPAATTTPAPAKTAATTVAKTAAPAPKPATTVQVAKPAVPKPALAPAPVVVVAPPPEPEPEPLVEDPAAAQGEDGDLGPVFNAAIEETQAEEKATELELVSETEAAPAAEETVVLHEPEPEPELAPTPGLTANQAQFKQLLEAKGFTLAEFLAWARGPILPKNAQTWADIPDARAAVMSQSLPGVLLKLTQLRNQKK